MRSNWFKQHLKSNQTLLIVLATVIALRLCIIAAFGQEGNSRSGFEPNIYDQFAIGIIDGTAGNNITAFGSTPIFLAPIYTLLKLVGLFDHRLALLQFINIGLMIGVLLLVRKTMQRFNYKEQTINLSLLLIGLNYQLAYLNSLILSENFFLILFAAVIWIALNIDRSTQPKYLIIFGLISALAIALRPIFLLVPITLLVVLVLKRLVNAKQLTFIVTTFLLTMLLVSLANQRFSATNERGFTSNGGANLVQTWCNARRVGNIDSTGQTSNWFSAPVNHGLHPNTDIYLPITSTSLDFIATGINCFLANPLEVVTNLGNLTNTIDSIFHPNFVNDNVLHNYLLAISKTLNLIMLGALIGAAVIKIYQRKGLFLLNHKLQLILIVIFSYLSTIYIANPGEERYFIPLILLIYPLTINQLVAHKQDISKGLNKYFYFAGLGFVIGSIILYMYLSNAVLRYLRPVPSFETVNSQLVKERVPLLGEESKFAMIDVNGLCNQFNCGDVAFRNMLTTAVDYWNCLPDKVSCVPSDMDDLKQLLNWKNKASDYNELLGGYIAGNIITDALLDYYFYNCKLKPTEVDQESKFSIFNLVGHINQQGLVAKPGDRNPVNFSNYPVKAVLQCLQN